MAGMRIRKALTVLLATTALAGVVPAVVARADSDDKTRVATVRDLIEDLPVADEQRDGYERTKFKHWVDADRDGCNTRAEVLKAEAVEAPTQGASCKLTGGEWWSYYDDTQVTDAAGLDIDHMVPLAEAWDSGAYNWTAQRRQDYANDLGYARSLVAVTARSNRQKADQDPADWMPPAQDARCTYLDDWVSVKTRWGLSVDEREQRALGQITEACPDATLDVPLA